MVPESQWSLGLKIENFWSGTNLKAKRRSSIVFGEHINIRGVGKGKEGACEGSWSERREESQGALKTQPKKNRLKGQVFCGLERFSHVVEESPSGIWWQWSWARFAWTSRGTWRLGEGWRWGRADSECRLFCLGLGMRKEENHGNNFGWIQGVEDRCVCVAGTVLIWDGLEFYNISAMNNRQREVTNTEASRGSWGATFGSRETIKLLEQNIGRIPYDINQSKSLYDPPPRVMEIKNKNKQVGPN